MSNLPYPHDGTASQMTAPLSQLESEQGSSMRIPPLDGGGCASGGGVQNGQSTFHQDNSSNVDWNGAFNCKGEDVGPNGTVINRTVPSLDDNVGDRKGEEKGTKEWKLGDVVLNGRYKVLQIAGQGNMGIVYKCTKISTGETFALKTVLSGGRMTAEDEMQFKKNYELVKSLNHDNIIRVNAMENDKATGQRYIEMDWIEGESLETHFRQFGGDRKLVAHETVRVLRKVADALDYAHGKGVVHRDVKDANIMIDKMKGRVLLIDFGIASREIRPFGTTNALKPEVEEVTVDFNSGTPGYQSPEQWDGLRPVPASDQYSLAVTAYKCLSNHLPFWSENMGQLQEMVMNDMVPPIRRLCKQANAVLAKAMSIKPEERYESCGKFIDALDEAIKSADVTPSNIGISEKEEGTEISPPNSKHACAVDAGEDPAMDEKTSNLPEWYRTFMKLMPEVSIFQHVKLGEGLVPYALGSDTGALLIYPMSCGSVEDAVKNLLATKRNLQEEEPDTGQEMILLMDEGQIDNTKELKNLGILCLDIAQFIAFAVTYYSHSNEQFRTGMMEFWNGDYKEAFEHLNVDDPTDPQVQYMLGFMYEHGKGVSQNMEMAKMLYLKAMLQGDELAKKALDNILDENRNKEQEHEAAISAAKKRYETAIHAGDWADAEIAARDRAAFGDGTFDQWYKEIEAARQKKATSSTNSEKAPPPPVLELSLTHSAERALQAQWKWPVGLESCIWGVSESQPTCLKDIERHKWNRLPRSGNGVSVVTLPSVGKGEQWIAVFGVVGGINHEIASEPNALCITKRILRYQLTGGGGLFGFGRKKETRLVVDSSTNSFPEFEIRAGEKNEVSRGNGRIVDQPSWSPVTKQENGLWRMSCLLEGLVFKHEHIRLFLKHPELVNCEITPVSSDKCEVK